jgi:Zn-dependent protease with chaperone function
MSEASAGNGGGSSPERRARTTLTGISSRAWEHPADRGALTALRQMKGFDVVLKRMAGLWDERALRLIHLGSAVRVDHRQRPQVHRAFVEAAQVLDVAALPELYVVADPNLNAMAIGIDWPFVVITSSLVDALDHDELVFVCGHELGHVLSGHALYRTMLLQLLRISASLSWLPLGQLGLRAIVAALQEWARKAELSGDRAGLLAVQDPAAAQRVHLKLAGGGRLDDIDIAAFRAQGDEYLSSPDLRDSLLKLLLLEARSHPFAVERAAQLRRWVDDGGYHAMLQGQYPKREDDSSASISGDAADAARSYRDAFAHSQDPLVAMIRDLGGGIGDVAGKVSTWFGSRRDADREEPRS